MLAACLILLVSHPAAALDQVSIQLKWKHQFQLPAITRRLNRVSIAPPVSTSPFARAADIDVSEEVAGGKAD